MYGLMVIQFIDEYASLDCALQVLHAFQPGNRLAA